MGTRIDMSGQRFGRWLVLREDGRDRHGQIMWRCRCDCGADGRIPGGRLRRGETSSCGCFRSERSAQANTKHGASSRGNMTAEYRAWSNMIDRCERPARRDFFNYGGRGIRVCQRWRESFAAFLADVGYRPSKRHSLDRIDNGRGYEPGNCRWATFAEQGNNKRNNRCLTVNGETATLSEWARRLGASSSETIAGRLRAGWPAERAATAPVRRR